MIHSFEHAVILTLSMQVLNVYKQIIPQFDNFIGQLQPQDQQALKTLYSI